MAHVAYKHYVLPPPGRKAKHRPLRTIEELAAEFGLTRQQLVGEMAHSLTPEPHPKPEIIPGGKKWYDPAAMRAWWKAHSALKESKHVGGTGRDPR